MTTHQKRLGVLSKMKTLLRKVRYTPFCAVEIYGKLFYLRESEVRALQVLAKQAYQESPEAFKEFSENVIVYNGQYKRKAKGILHFCNDGYFNEIPQSGIFDANTKLAKILM